jgi:radical SAM protein with 4Fe4S-binding SPASM domain
VQSYFGQHPAYRRMTRHIGLLRRYATATKLINIGRTELARFRGDIVLRSRPFIYTVDIGNVCNLRCPLCPTGYNGLQRSQGLMKLGDFERILEKIKPYAIEVVLHNWGEPFLNPHFCDMVQMAKQARVGTAVSTNLNLVRRGTSFLRQVVDSGLDHLVVSLDGTTQAVYEHYRKNGDVERVLANLRELIVYKRTTAKASPVIEWQYLVMKHNEHQIEEAIRLAKSIGVDEIGFTGAGLPFDELKNLDLAAEWLARNPRYRGYDPQLMLDRGYLYDVKCFYLYRAMTLNPHGEVSPCCALHHSKWDFGNLLDSSLDEVWNSEHYRSARSLFSRKRTSDPVDTACHHCPLFKYESTR